MTNPWPDRADAAERAVLDRYLRRPAALPGVQLAVVASPARPVEWLHLRWHLWWQAHLLDCLVDAVERAPTKPRTRRIIQLARGIRLRNGGRWLNDYHDDVAWLGLAVHRAGPLIGSFRAVPVIVNRLRGAWINDDLGGLPWRRGDVLRNAPAVGPAAILLARTGFRDEAQRLANWIHDRLTRPDGLIADGVRDGGVLVDTVYTYNQGVTLGADLETGRPDRVPPLLEAVSAHLQHHGVLIGHGGGDGGLFTGILVRYLTLVAVHPAVGGPARRLARDLVLSSADSAWKHAAHPARGPIFGLDWAQPADPALARDLSVQLGGWMLLEAAARIERRQS